mmetsp:Transcript_30375/g.66369  ORF Transcript_30375/g.66369 Transcript_30375/m.66369 type:complete len:246 (-) Transcript_30375:449-1186(-)
MRSSSMGACYLVLDHLQQVTLLLNDVAVLVQHHLLTDEVHQPSAVGGGDAVGDGVDGLLAVDEPHEGVLCVAGGGHHVHVAVPVLLVGRHLLHLVRVLRQLLARRSGVLALHHLQVPPGGGVLLVLQVEQARPQLHDVVVVGPPHGAALLHGGVDADAAVDRHVRLFVLRVPQLGCEGGQVSPGPGEVGTAHLERMAKHTQHLLVERWARVILHKRDPQWIDLVFVGERIGPFDVIAFVLLRRLG